MQPIVNGLEDRYGKNLEFRLLNANSQEGGEAFRYYQLFGHPGYVILDLDGQVVWSGLGEQSSEALEEQILGVLKGP